MLVEAIEVKRRRRRAMRRRRRAAVRFFRRVRLRPVVVSSELLEAGRVDLSVALRAWWDR